MPTKIVLIEIEDVGFAIDVNDTLASRYYARIVLHVNPKHHVIRYWSHSDN